MRRRLRIRLDLDGVVYDLVEEMLPLLRDLAGRPVRHEHIVEFHIPRALGLDMTDRNLFQKVAEKGLYWSAREPMRDAKEYIEKMQRDRHEVTVVTSRPKTMTVSGRKIDVETKTREWVQRQFDCSLGVEVMGERVDERVEKVVDEHKVHLFIDDDPAALARVRSLGGKALPVAFDQPWNRSWPGDRVLSWADLYDFVKHESGRFRAFYE